MIAAVDGAWDAGFATGALIGVVIAIVSLKWDRIVEWLIDFLAGPAEPPTPLHPQRPNLRLITRPFDFERDT